ncbi:MAG: ROK family protein [Bacteroidetes bacterium]|jgi:glucokinase|nr:ROK family protein [Bacteroidota bacterium]
MDVSIGVDLGGTYTKYGLVTESGEVAAEHFIKTDSSMTYEEFFQHLYGEIVNLHVNTLPEATLVGIGVGAPSGNSLTGTIDKASNLAWPENIPVAELLGKQSGLRVSVTNDANAAAVGELKYGVAKGMDNFISLTLGTGLGCGIVINGKLLTGQSGHAGELGHITAVQNGRLCGCGRLGCLETYASAPGLRKTVTELLESTDLESVFRRKKKTSITGKDITHEAAKGDKLSIEAFERTGEILGRSLADAVAFLNPSLIVLSGGLARAGDLLMVPTTKYFEENLLEVFKGSVSIKLSEMTKKNAAILGAAAIAWEERRIRSDAQYA